MGIEPTADDLVSVLLLNPTLACEVVRELSESTVAAPWEPASGTENGYARVYVRKHISGTSHIATVGRTAASAVWWTLDGEPEFAGSELLARVAAEHQLIKNGWTLADRGYRTDWKFGTFAWLVRTVQDQVVLARVKGDNHQARYELEEFALSTSDRLTKLQASGFPNVRAAMAAVDTLLVRHGWEWPEGR